MLDDAEHDPWAAPPDWVHLPDVPDWIERRLGLPGLSLVPSLISALRAGGLRYRIGIPSRHLNGSDRFPDGYAVYPHPKRVVVSDWEKADPDWRAGTVAGWKLADGSRSRHRIEVSWLAIERWAALPAAAFASMARKAAAAPAKATPPNLPERDAQPPKASKAARRGSIGYAQQDAALVQEMRVLLCDAEKAGKKADPWPAAMAVADRAAGENTLISSKAKRLLRRYSDTFPSGTE